MRSLALIAACLAPAVGFAPSPLRRGVGSTRRVEQPTLTKRFAKLEEEIASSAAFEPAPTSPDERASNQEAIFKKYGVATGGARVQDASDGSEPSFSLDLINLVPDAAQSAIDRALVLAVGLSLAVFVASGVAITIEAFAVASKQTLPPFLDSFIVNIVEPAFTPSVGVFFFFSISLGLFKGAQLSREDANYAELPENE